MKFTVIVASNNPGVLQSCLLASPDLKYGIEIIVETGAVSAGAAYNAGMQKANGEVLIFVHQDVFLPPGWCNQLSKTIDYLSDVDPSWGVLGVFGSDFDGEGHGHLYTSGLRNIVGSPLENPLKVQTVDEVLLVLRRSCGLCFDEELPGFHLYGADICLEAGRHGFNNYVIEAFCIHNSNGIGMLPWAYWRSWLYMRRKWWHWLPVTTPCMSITRQGGAVLRYMIKRPLWLTTHRHYFGHRMLDPELLWEQLSSENAYLQLSSSEKTTPVVPLSNDL